MENTRLLLAGMAMQSLLTVVTANEKIMDLVSEVARDKEITIQDHVAAVSLSYVDALIAQEANTGITTLQEEVEQLRLDNQMYRAQNEELCPENNKLRAELAQLRAENENLSNVIAVNGINTGLA